MGQRSNNPLDRSLHRTRATMILEFEVDLKPIQRRIEPAQVSASPAPPPPGTVALLLAHQIARAIAAGQIRDSADAARQLGWSRARVTQIMRLLRLAPAIQEWLLTAPAEQMARVSERRLRAIAGLPLHDQQQRPREQLLAERATATPR
ncbi:MAG: hypothetical protein U1A27_13440 [Phycisphaerae bacterium]